MWLAQLVSGQLVPFHYAMYDHKDVLIFPFINLLLLIVGNIVGYRHIIFYLQIVLIFCSYMIIEHLDVDSDHLHSSLYIHYLLNKQTFKIIPTDANSRLINTNSVYTQDTYILSHNFKHNKKFAYHIHLSSYNFCCCLSTYTYFLLITTIKIII